MDTRQRQRLAVMRSVVGALRSPDFDSAFLAETAGVEVPIIVALENDPVSLFIEQVERYQRAGYLVSLVGERELAIITFRPADPCESPVDHEECPIHPDSEIGMLIEYVRRVRGPVRCALICPECEVEFTDEGDCTGVSA